MVLLQETFDQGMTHWWVEGGERVWVEDGRLHMRADAGERGAGQVCTAWCRIPIHGDVRISFEAHVIASMIAANNINLFFFYADPTGKPLEETREERADANYPRYHSLNGYIVTFLRDTAGAGGAHEDGTAKARVRIRRCPGFQLLSETFATHCEAGVTYRCEVTRRGGRITFAVDGATLLEADDPQPLQSGLLGLRTFRTYLWWDNVTVTALP